MTKNGNGDGMTESRRRKVAALVGHLTGSGDVVPLPERGGDFYPQPVLTPVHLLVFRDTVCAREPDMDLVGAALKMLDRVRLA